MPPSGTLSFAERSRAVARHELDISIPSIRPSQGIFREDLGRGEYMQGFVPWTVVEDVERAEVSGNNVFVVV
jgi:hypothetical protein